MSSLQMPGNNNNRNVFAEILSFRIPQVTSNVISGSLLILKSEKVSGIT